MIRFCCIEVRINLIVFFLPWFVWDGTDVLCTHNNLDISHTGCRIVDHTGIYRAFGALRRSVLLDSNLNISIKCKVNLACVLSVVLYRSECWTPLTKNLKKLDSFHNGCIRTILGISNKQQWSERITSLELRQRWGDLETATVKVMKRCLEWLGNLARMPDHCITKICLFSWLPQPCPWGSPRQI